MDNVEKLEEEIYRNFQASSKLRECNAELRNNIPKILIEKEKVGVKRKSGWNIV